MRGTKHEQRQQSIRFLKALRRTANVTMAAEEAGISRKAMEKRRARNPDFAAEWDAAVAFAQARLAAGAGASPPKGEVTVTAGGEYTVRASRGRALQVRRAPKGLLTAEGERTFLAHLAATCNVRLSAAAVGIGWNAIYARRQRSAQFATAMDAALREGYDRLEMALVGNAIASFSPDGTAIDDWGEDAAALPGPLERMSVEQALLLLAYRRSEMAFGVRHKAPKMRKVPPEQTNAALLRSIEMSERYLARKAARKAAAKD